MRIPKLDKNFQPFIRTLEEYERDVAAAEHTAEAAIAVKRNGDCYYVYRFRAFSDGAGQDMRNCLIAERIAKTILWTAGGYEIAVAGNDVIYDYIKRAYCAGGARAFDAEFMSGVYEQPFRVVKMRMDEVPQSEIRTVKAGGNLKGCRIGFDAGGSDRKVSAVIDGTVVYSEEVVWHPKTTEDPNYHYNGILTAFQTAASKMPRVDGIGVSSAGVTVDNKMMVASLFIKVDKRKHGDFLKNIYINAAKEIGNVPLVVANDGDVTALAGSIDLNDNCVLGIAMGTSEAVGYINREGGLNGWLSELAFVPVDFNPQAMQDEWSGDRGVGCKYFSQDAVIKLAESGGHVFEENATPAEKLKEIQALMVQDNALARQIYEDIGVYLAYTLPFYLRFYEVKHVLLLGRVTAGKGGRGVARKLQTHDCGRIPRAERVRYIPARREKPQSRTKHCGGIITARHRITEKRKYCKDCEVAVGRDILARREKPQSRVKHCGGIITARHCINERRK